MIPIDIEDARDRALAAVQARVRELEAELARYRTPVDAGEAREAADEVLRLAEETPTTLRGAERWSARVRPLMAILARALIEREGDVDRLTRQRDQSDRARKDLLARYDSMWRERDEARAELARREEREGAWHLATGAHDPEDYLSAVQGPREKEIDRLRAELASLRTRLDLVIADEPTGVYQEGVAAGKRAVDASRPPLTAEVEAAIDAVVATSGAVGPIGPGRMLRYHHAVLRLLDRLAKMRDGQSSPLTAEQRRAAWDALYGPNGTRDPSTGAIRETLTTERARMSRLADEAEAAWERINNVLLFEAEAEAGDMDKIMAAIDAFHRAARGDVGAAPVNPADKCPTCDGDEEVFHGACASPECDHWVPCPTCSAAPTATPSPSKIVSVIAFLRENFRDDGAEGESIHLLCNEVERLTRAAPTAPLTEEEAGEAAESLVARWQADRGLCIGTKIAKADLDALSIDVAALFAASRGAVPPEVRPLCGCNGPARQNIYGHHARGDEGCEHAPTTTNGGAK